MKSKVEQVVDQLLSEEKSVPKGKEKLPEVGDVWTLYGVDVEVLDVDDVNKDIFARITIEELGGGPEKTMTVIDFLNNGFKFKTK
jgi:hypothetical protein